MIVCQSLTLRRQINSKLFCPENIIALASFPGVNAQLFTPPARAVLDVQSQRADIASYSSNEAVVEDEVIEEKPSGMDEDPESENTDGKCQLHPFAL